MPRKTIVINDFSGGLVEESLGRDLRPNEFKTFTDVDVSNKGTIKMIGHMIYDDPDHSENPFQFCLPLATNEPNLTFTGGHGAFIFSIDKVLVAGTTGLDVVALGFNSTDSVGRVYIIDNNHAPWSDTNSSPNIDVVSPSSGGFKPVYSYIDGALRISNGHFHTSGSNPNTNKWFGHIKRTQFNWTNPPSSFSIDGWKSIDAVINPPTAGVWSSAFFKKLATNVASDSVTFKIHDAGDLVGCSNVIDNGDYCAVNLSDTSTFGIAVGVVNVSTPQVLQMQSLAATTGAGASKVYWNNGDSYIFAPKPGKGIAMEARAFSGAYAGTWTTGAYDFGLTYIYDGNQESSIYEMTGKGTTIQANEHLKVIPIFHGPYPQRVTGGRVYTRLQGSTNTWGAILEFNFVKGDENYGVKQIENNKVLPFATFSTDMLLGKVWHCTGLALTSDPVETYETLNGYTQDTSFLSFQYKTAAFINRQLYIGNVRRFDSSIVFGDTIYKSIPNKFDIFPAYNRLDVVTGDGDEIIKLETYADRLLQFKKKKLYIINVAQDVEFLEAELDHRGVNYPNHVCRTEYGIAWFNRYGAFLYDGQTVHDLCLDPSDPTRRKLLVDQFDLMCEQSDANIGYDAKNKKLFFIATGEYDPGSFYDFPNRCWTTLSRITS